MVCLMYLTTTRPNILNVVSILSWFMYCATEIHLKATKWVVRYVKDIINFGIKFKKSKEFKLFRLLETEIGQYMFMIWKIL